MNIKGFQLGVLGTNGYLVWPENSTEAFFVDPGGYHKEVTNVIKEEGLTLKYIILTHGHYDHIGGVEQFMADFPEAKLVASKEEAELLKDPNINHSLRDLGTSISLTADVEVSDGDTLDVGGATLKIISTPGHTKGGISIYVENMLFSGDTLFRMSIGRTDLSGGDFPTLIASIKNKLFVLPDDTQVLPGHMGFTTIEIEKQFNPYARGDI